jgi:uncharacterized membrane protein (UPF0127 family)
MKIGDCLMYRTEWSDRSPIWAIFCYALPIVFPLLLSVSCSREEVPQKNSDKAFSDTVFTSAQPDFIREGSLAFLRGQNRDQIVQIDIEVAETPQKLMTGLMYRHSMPEKAGMLFVLQNIKASSFWMKNTYIPLDIIFADGNRKIIKIQKNTKPLSEKQIPVPKDTVYVVEVNAGFCAQYGIRKGNFVKFP